MNRDLRVKLESGDHKVQEEIPVHKDRTEDQDLRDQTGLKVLAVNRDQEERLAPRGKRDLMVALDQEDNQDRRVLLVMKAPRALMVIPALKALVESLDQMDNRDLEVM